MAFFIETVTEGNSGKFTKILESTVYNGMYTIR